MMVRIEYEGGRTTLFDTLSFTEGSPFSGANMLTECELEMREKPEKGLWLTANWHQVRDDWRADAPADDIPATRRLPGCGDTCATRLRFPLATASTWALPQNR